MTESIRLTQYSKGAGCGCKISPSVLKEILGKGSFQPQQGRLLVGNDGQDDAAAYDMLNGTALIATTDFFMPVVDDPFTFGRVAAANALSDVYAMGGSPLFALAILGWPIEKLPASIASVVMDGARAMCHDAGVLIAGGHTIESQEPIFGLAVTGQVELPFLKQNKTAQPGDYILISKPIGAGLLTTAMKRERLQPEHVDHLIHHLTTLNKLGEKLGRIPGITAMTDITGFGLAGHLKEVCLASDVSAQIFYASIPLMQGVQTYIQQGILPDATYRNWNAIEQDMELDPQLPAMDCFALLPDPQTNGGLLIAVSPDELNVVLQLAEQENNTLTCIGKFIHKSDKPIYVKAGPFTS